MADRWYNLPAVPDPDTDGTLPKYADQVDGSTGQTIANSPRYVVRFYADTATLDGIASEPEVTELSDSGALNLLQNGGAPIENGGDGWDVARLNEAFEVT